MAFDFNVDLFSWIDQWRKTTKLFAWISLIFQMSFSAFVTFCGVCGGILAAGKPWSVAIGFGLCGVATTLATFFASSDLTRGMMFVRPTQLAQDEIQQSEAITRK